MTPQYEEALARARATARQMGYALAVHGSEGRDLDLIAVPWVAEAVSAETLALAIKEAVGGFIVNHVHADEHDFTQRNPQPKPHGRLAWSIHLVGGPYLDLSVMPRAEGDAR